MHGDGRPFTVFVVAGEELGDLLGAGLMRALDERLGGQRALSRRRRRAHDRGSACSSLFPMEEIALHGLTAVIVAPAASRQRASAGPPRP